MYLDLTHFGSSRAISTRETTATGGTLHREKKIKHILAL